MSTDIDRDEVRQLAGDATLVEVLPSESYERLHLPRAINIPLARLTRQAVAELDRDGPVVVYCYDRQ